MKSARRLALDDAEEIVRVAYYDRCDVDGAPCPKCVLLERITRRIGEWQSEEIDAANRAARAKAEAERAVLSAASEWREAERTLSAVRFERTLGRKDFEQRRALIDTAAGDCQARLAALRSAVDDWLRARGGSETKR